MEEAKEALRALVEKVVLVPVEAEDGGTRLAIDLHGALAGLLRLATGQPLPALAGTQKNPREAGRVGAINGQSACAGSEATDFADELVLVAGTGFEPVTFRL